MKKWIFEFALPCTANLHQFEFYCLPWPFFIEKNAMQLHFSRINNFGNKSFFDFWLNALKTCDLCWIFPTPQFFTGNSEIARILFIAS
jgi:hypothetical protein